MASAVRSTPTAIWAGFRNPARLMAYTSAYTDHYQNQGKSGESYDRSLANRFELAIFRLEHAILRDLFRRLRSSDPDTAYLEPVSPRLNC